MCTTKCPLHLLLLNEPPAHNLVDRGLNERSANRLALSVALAKIRDRFLVVADVGLEFRCRVSLLIGLGLRILKDFHAWEPLKFCFIEYTFAVIKTPREPHFPSRNQHYVLDSTRLPF
jgi:hypothetical protein